MPKRMYCNGCSKQPHELDEYVDEARYEYSEDLADDDPRWNDLPTEQQNLKTDEWAWYNEGTTNWENGHYLCTECYIKAGMPSSRYGWKAP